MGPVGERSEVVFWVDHIWFVALCAQAEAARLPQGTARTDLLGFCSFVDLWGGGRLGVP